MAPRGPPPLAFLRYYFATVQRNWAEAVAQLRAVTSCGEPEYEALAWALLGEVLRTGMVNDEDVVLPTDPAAAASAHAKACTLYVRNAAEGGTPTAAEESFLETAVWGSYLTFVQPALVTDAAARAELVKALGVVAATCDKSPAPNDGFAAILAHVALANAAFSPPASNAALAARHFRRALAVGERVGTLPDERAERILRCAARSLAGLEAKTVDELCRVTAVTLLNKAPDETLVHKVPVEMSSYAPAAQRPACSACGKTPLTLKVCGGTCRGAVRYCDATCHAAHIREHMRESGCRKRK